MFKATIEGKVLNVPNLVFTRRGNPAAEAVLREIDSWNTSEGKWDVQTRVFDTGEEIRAHLSNGQDPSRAIVLWDERIGKRFTFAAPGRTSGPKMPSFAHGAQWGVVVNEGVVNPVWAVNCAQQLTADFGRKFDERVTGLRHFPWGKPKNNEQLPDRPMLASEMAQIVERLNNGPTMADEVFEGVRDKLPAGQMFSWLRVPDRPAEYSREMMGRCLDAVEGFETASAALLTAHPEVADKLMLGVTLDPQHPELQELYLQPCVDGVPLQKWSVRRPDMHVCGDKLVASENDEMPGGFIDCFHVDRSYGINTEQWNWCLDWLCSQGPLLFVVSDEWSAPYIPAMRWMTEQMRQSGQECHMVTSGELEQLTVNDEGVFLNGDGGADIKIGTIWRQFPVFETKGMLAELVAASGDGRVRMVPEFAHFGNKTWFALYHEYRGFFQQQLGREMIETLDMLIPNTRLVIPGSMVNITLAGVRVQSWSDLVNLPEATRSKLVLKITGANAMAARSYGVFMGQAQNQQAWKEWLDKRQSSGEAFIVQERFETSVERIGVYNTSTRQAEPFACRVLLRPWVVDGRLVTSHSACTPHYTTKIHGMLDMAVQPIVWT